MLNRLGGLNPRFFELFIKALRFEPIRNIRDFVEQWVLPEHPLELENLRRVGERLESLEQDSRKVQEQLGLLHQVLDRQTEVRRLRRLRDQWQVAKTLLEVAAAQRRAETTQSQLTDRQSRTEVKSLALRSIKLAASNAPGPRCWISDSASASIHLALWRPRSRNENIPTSSERAAANSPCPLSVPP